MITSQLPVDHWHEVIVDPTITDAPRSSIEPLQSIVLPSPSRSSRVGGSNYPSNSNYRFGMKMVPTGGYDPPLSGLCPSGAPIAKAVTLAITLTRNDKAMMAPSSALTPPIN
jgi:hypothetical protein